MKKLLNIIRVFKARGISKSVTAAVNWLFMLFHRNVLGRKHLVRRIYTYKMKLPIDQEGIQGISKALVMYGTREEDQLRIVKEELKEGMRVLDIGANIGYYSLLLASIVGPTGKVYSIEPSSQNFRLLKENIALNHAENIVDVFHMGVSDKVSSENLYLSIHSNSHSFFRGTLHSKKTEKGEGETEPVEMTDVDSFVKGKEPIHFIRMDVEGFEVKVFQGMKSFIENSSNEIKILFEVHRSRYDEKDFNMREQLTRLFKLGFVPKTLIAKPLLKSKPYGIYPFSERGYSPDFLIPTDGFQRGYYTNISQNDVLDYVCSLGCVRALLLVRMPQAATQRETSYSRLSE